MSRMPELPGYIRVVARGRVRFTTGLKQVSCSQFVAAEQQDVQVAMRPQRATAKLLHMLQS